MASNSIYEASAIMIGRCPEPDACRIPLPSSKSESNRALIIRALCGAEAEVENLSTARDTQTMIHLLASEEPVADVRDAGTTMRFLTAFYALTGQRKTLTGTARMQERPIGILVDALRSLGAELDYTGVPGFPPVQTLGFPGQRNREIRIRGDVSSQYISALMMMGPVLPKGLLLRLEGRVGSRPYIAMTAALMRHFGANVAYDGEALIEIDPKPYTGGRYTIESDWSGASYWYSLAALSEKSEIRLLGLRRDSFQGDQIITRIMQNLGVEVHFEPSGLLLVKAGSMRSFESDFSDCPDLAQTVAVACAGAGITAVFKGLESLRIKETDRTTALQRELARIGAAFTHTGDEVWSLTPPAPGWGETASPAFDTYDDHRMAMAFAPLATKTGVIIRHPSVVRKSYPEFWDHLMQAGFRISPVDG